MQEITVDSAYLAELRKGSTAAFEDLYSRYFRMVEDLVFKYNGSTEDARDIFQEALFVFVKKLRDPEFTLTSKASTFIYAIARNLYLKKTGKATVEISMDNEKFNILGKTDEPAEGMSATEKNGILDVMNDKLAQLEEDCRGVITYSFYQGLSHTQIAALMGYTEAFVKVKKFRCLEYLRKLVKATDVFKNL